MVSKLAQVLNSDVLNEILNEKAAVEDVVQQLFMKGYELSKVVQPKTYTSWEEFKSKHADDDSELVELEGSSTIDNEDVVILKGCPMGSEMKKLNVDGSPPAFHSRIVEDYMEQNPGSNAILHPGCIAHQVARQLIIKNTKINDVKNLNFYQLACRSMASGKIVYDENGLKAVGLSKEKADKLINGFACLFAMIKN